jgi:hypothetical protein
VPKPLLPCTVEVAWVMTYRRGPDNNYRGCTGGYYGGPSSGHAFIQAAYCSANQSLLQGKPLPSDRRQANVAQPLRQPVARRPMSLF